MIPKIEDAIRSRRRAGPPRLHDVFLQARINNMRVRSWQNLRYHTAMAVFFFTGLFLATMVYALANFSQLNFSTQAIPMWISIAVATPAFIVADILAISSLLDPGNDHRSNRRSLTAFGLTAGGYVILIGTLEVIT